MRRPGTWVALSDNLPDHPSVADLSDPAFRLFISLLCHCSRYLTDGHVTTAIASRYAAPKVIQELLRSGVMVPADRGYQFPDYLRWNRSRATAESLKRGGSADG